MNAQQKQKLIQWQSGEVYRLPDASKIRLDDLIKTSRNKYNLVNEYAIPLLMDSIHPALYYYYCIDWSKFPSSRVPQGFRDNIAFGRHVNEAWLAICNRYGYFRDGLLENYQTIDQLRDNISLLLHTEAPGKLYYSDGFDRMEEQLSIMRDNDIEHEAAIEAERLAKEEADRLQREEEAKRKQEEADKKKKKKQAEHEAEAQANREFHDKDGSPWTKDSTTTPSISEAFNADSSDSSNANVTDGAHIVNAPLKHTVHAGPGSSIDRQMQLLQDDFYEFYRLTKSDLATVHLDLHYSGKKKLYSIQVHVYCTDHNNNMSFTSGRQLSIADCLITLETKLHFLVSKYEAEVRQQHEAEERQKKKDAMQQKIDEAMEKMRKFQEQQMAEIKKMQEQLNNL